MEMRIEAEKEGQRVIISQTSSGYGIVVQPTRFVGYDDDGEVVYTSPVYAVQRYGAGYRNSVYESFTDHEVPYVLDVLKAISRTPNNTGARMNSFLDQMWYRMSEVKEAEYGKSMSPATEEKMTDDEVIHRKEFVWIADIKCIEPEVMRFVTENDLSPQEAFEEEACFYAGSEVCEECDWRVKD